MQKLVNYLRRHERLISGLIVLLAGMAWLLLYKLGSLTGGLGAGEVSAATVPVGWHGIYHEPFYLPLKTVRSVVFVLFAHHGQTLTRLPNAAFGALTIISFAWLIRLWHSTRITALTGVLFATSAWTLHVSRLASFDVMYLWAMPTLLLIYTLLQKYHDKAVVWYGSMLAWGLLLYIPGMVWFIVLSLYFRRTSLLAGWRHFSPWWKHLLYVLAGLIWLPLLILHFIRSGGLLTWLGWPARLAKPFLLLKHLAGVPVHLFIRGPEYPNLWLGRAPILDVFTLAACVIGIYFYATRWRAGRTRLLVAFAIIGAALVGLGGPVPLSLLVPLLYVAAAAGVAYLLREWLQTFPSNPLARGLGLGLVTIAVVLSCIYNLRAYFVAWPHNQATHTIFRYRR